MFYIIGFATFAISPRIDQNETEMLFESGNVSIFVPIFNASESAMLQYKRWTITLQFVMDFLSLAIRKRLFNLQ